MIPQYQEKTIYVPSYVEKTVRVPTVIEKKVKVPAQPKIIEKKVEAPPADVKFDQRYVFVTNFICVFQFEHYLMIISCTN